MRGQEKACQDDAESGPDPQQEGSFERRQASLSRGKPAERPLAQTGTPENSCEQDRSVKEYGQPEVRASEEVGGYRPILWPERTPTGARRVVLAGIERRAVGFVRWGYGVYVIRAQECGIIAGPFESERVKLE